jgi:iron complex outermembrane receptor protein
MGRGDLVGDSEGVFGQATWRPFADRRLGLTAGLRYDDAQRDLDRQAATFSTFPGLDEERGDDMWLPKFAVDYRLEPDKLIYVSAAEGWITDWWGNRLRINAAGFYNDVSNYQDLVYIDPVDGYLANAKKAYTRGFELEVIGRPLPGLELSGSLGYVNAFYDDYVYNQAEGLNLDGRRIPQVPDYDFSLAAEYRFGFGWLPLGANAFARAEMLGSGTFVDYQFSTGSATSGAREFVAPGYHVFNLKAGLETERWSVYGYVTNLADAQYFTRYELGFGALSAYKGPVGVVGDPRIAGVGFSLRY